MINAAVFLLFGLLEAVVEHPQWAMSWKDNKLTQRLGSKNKGKAQALLAKNTVTSECRNTAGKVANTDACTCGESECVANQFCDAAGNNDETRCLKTAKPETETEVTCQNTAGKVANTDACTCG